MASVTVFLAMSAGSGAAFGGSCPHEQLRSENNSTQLPDCRAYEMVSPAYTEGFYVSGSRFVVHATSAFGPSPSFGAGIFFGESFGVFAGAQNTNIPFGGNYLFRHTPSGWTTTPFEPSFTQFPDSAVNAQPVVSSDLQSSLWELGTSSPGSTAILNRNYYLRNPTGTFAVIGPSAPPGTKAGLFSLRVAPEEMGTSGDLSHFLFNSTDTVEEEPFWPGDNTIIEHPSLYEYVGTNNATPTLVGVSGGAGSHELISQCGTSLGGNTEAGGAASTYNAVSTNGMTVFFSVAPGGCFGLNPLTETEELGQGPSVSELYARMNGEETVAISEPTITDCAECQEDSPEAASFRAASVDGSKVLFTTTQQLLPSDTDSTSDLYEYDFNAPAGHRIIQISAGGSGDVTPGTGAGVQGLTTVSPDLSHVYFVATGVLTTTVNAHGEEAEAGKNNLYVYEPDPAHPGQSKTVYIATLDPADSSDWAGFDSHDGNSVQVTPDGRFLLFPSAAHLTLGNTSSAAQLFQYATETENLIRISICQTGYNCANNGNVAIGTGRREQSTDGMFVFFNSRVPLVPQAVASMGFNSVYEYHEGNVYLISDGRDTTGFGNSHGSEVVGIGLSGSDVYFVTGDALLPSDTNTQVGIYDARIEGGFPQSAIASACKEDACQGQPSAPSVGQSPASADLFGSGNLAPVPPTPAPPKLKCSKGKKLSHGQCIKTKSKSKSKSKKRPKARKSGHSNRRFGK